MCRSRLFLLFLSESQMNERKKMSCEAEIYYHANESGYSLVEILLSQFGIALVLTAAFTYNYNVNENVHFSAYLHSYRQNLTKRIKKEEQGKSR